MLNWKIIITSIVLLWFFFVLFFLPFQPTKQNMDKYKQKYWDFVNHLMLFSSSCSSNGLPALWEGLVSRVRAAGERSCDRLLTGGRLLLGLHVFPSSAHYFYTPLLPDFFYSCRCCRRVDVQNHIMSKFTETAPRHRETCTFNGLTFITSPLLGHK